MKTYEIYPQVLVALAAYGGAFIFGISLGWSSPAAPRLLSSESDFVVSKNQFSWVVAIMALGATFATASAGIMRNQFGTKNSVLLFGVPTTFGWILVVFAKNSEMLMLGRFFSGFAAGAYGILLPLYIGEIASKEIRGSLLSLYQIILNFGEVFVFTLGHYASFPVLNIVCGIIPIIYCITFTKLPESPVFLINKKMNDKALRSLTLLRGKRYNCEDELNEIRKHQEMNHEEKSFVEHLKHKATRKAFLIVLTQFFFFQFTGINAVLFYTTQIFIEANIKIDPGVASILVVSSQILGTSFSAVLVDRVGRRAMLVVSTVLMTLSHIAIGTYFQMKDSGESVEHLSWLPIVSLSVFEMAFGCGIGPISYVLLGELFTPNAKRVIAPVGKSFNLFLAFVVGLVFPYLVEIFGNSGTFYMFAGFSVLAFLFTIVFIPETKGKSFAEIQEILAQ